MPDEKRIKDFEPATELLIDDWFVVDSPSQGTRKMQASMFQEGLQTQITANTENIALHSGQISVLQQAVGNIGDKVDVLDAAITVEEYSAAKLYAVGEDCVYEGVRYKCITAIETPEAFDPNKWQAISIEGELNELNSSIGVLEGHGYVVTQWVTFTYFNATQLEGTYTPPTVPSGYSYRLLGCMPLFANNTLGAKFSGKFLSSAGNKLRALGTGFASGESENFLVLFLIFKS